MSHVAIFGQYWTGTSFVHRLDPRVKMLLSLALMAVIFCAQSWVGLGLCACFIGGFFLLAQIPFAQAFRSIAPLMFLVVFTALLNAFFVQSGEVYFELWVFSISEGGLVRAAFVGIRLTLLLLCASLLTLTTATLDITEAFERLLTPFARLGLPAHELGMMMGIALRFLPQFVSELRIVYRAQISRGANISLNPFAKGGNSLLSLMVPLFTSAFRHAETLSSAMDARCYHGGKGRSRLHGLKLSARDAAAVAAVVLMLACILVSNGYFPAAI